MLLLVNNVVKYGDSSTHFLYDIVYQQQHKGRDSNACLSVRSSKNIRFHSDLFSYGGAPIKKYELICKKVEIRFKKVIK